MTTIEAIEQRNRYIKVDGIGPNKVETIYGNSSAIYSKIVVNISGEVIYLKHNDDGVIVVAENVFLADTQKSKMKINKFKEEIKVEPVEGKGEKENTVTKVVTLKEAEEALISEGKIGKKGIEENKPKIINFISKNGNLIVKLSDKKEYLLAKNKNGEIIIEACSLGDR